MTLVNISSLDGRYVEEAMHHLDKLGYIPYTIKNNSNFIVVETPDDTADFLVRVMFFDKQ